MPFSLSLAVSLFRRSVKDFFSPANAPKPPPPALKLPKPLALALLLPRPENADCPNAEDDPEGEDMPNASLVVPLAAAAPKADGCPKADGAPKVGLAAAEGVFGVEGPAASAGGVPPKADGVVGAFGGLKNGEDEGGAAEPNAPKPESSFPNPDGELVRFENAPPGTGFVVANDAPGAAAFAKTDDF